MTDRVFEWDPVKASSNRSKHGLSFERAIRVFDDPGRNTEPDRVERGEVRWKTIGVVGEMTLVVVAHTDQDEGDVTVTRLISARRASRSERRKHEEGE